MTNNLPFLDFDQFTNMTLIKKYDFFTTNKLFSEVYKIEEKETGEHFIANVSRPEESEETDSPLLMANNVYNFDHPSLLKVIGYSKTKIDNVPRTVVITEYFSKGILSDYINSEKSGSPKAGWTNTKKLISIYGIASGLLYLHSHNFIHRDIKPSKILLDDSLFPVIRGFNVLIKSDDKDSEKVFKGNPEYMAPEILMREKSTKAMDVYSFAMVIYEIITLKKPFDDINHPNIIQVLQRVQQGKLPNLDESIPEAFRDLIQRCWSLDPEERPTFNEIVRLLRTDPDFIFDGVDKEEFFDYVKLLDHYQIIKTKRRSSLTSGSSNQEVQSLRELLVAKTSENNLLREEIENLKRSLNEQKEKLNVAMEQLHSLQNDGK